MIANSFFILFSLIAHGQLFFKNTLKANEQKTYRNLIQNSILKNISQPLSTETEEDWMSAFTAMEVIQYKTLWLKARVDSAAINLPKQSIQFQRAALELLYSNYQNLYYEPVKLLLLQTQEPKIFAMAAEYILQSDRGKADINFLQVKLQQLQNTLPQNTILQQLAYRLQQAKQPIPYPDFAAILSNKYLLGKTIIYSFQRKNRNYPGLLLIKDAQGNFVKDSNGGIFNVPQLARSITNLPGYLTNGNTPQGIYSLQGNDVSRSIFIGPTVNLQMRMPYETTVQNFFGWATDKEWDINDYKNLLPTSLQNYQPLYQSFYAGQIGRTDIIVHGSALNPEYYSGEPYYPLTPTMGCLTSKEVWDPQTGYRTQSDQQKIINALIPLGFKNGYVIVIEINDAEKPVTLIDLAQYIP